MKDYDTMTADEWANKFNLDLSFTEKDALAALAHAIKHAADGHGHMTRSRDNSHVLYVGLSYSDAKHYSYSLRWNLDKREVRVVKDKRYYPYGSERYEEYRESFFSVTFPETNWLIQRVLKAFEVRGRNERYNKLWSAFLGYCYKWRKELL